MNFLSRKGLVSSHITLKKIINLKQRKLDLIFNIQMGKRKIIKFEGNTLFTEKKIKEDFIGFDQPEWFPSRRVSVQPPAPAPPGSLSGERSSPVPIRVLP